MSGRGRVVLHFLVVAGVCLVFDQASKYAIEAWVRASEGEVVLVQGWARFVYRLNQGGVFSLGTGFGSSANAFLAIFAAAAVTLILGWGLLGLRAEDKTLAVILGAILGGALGNLYDRLVFFAVRDFIDVVLPIYGPWPTFNLADSFLVCGAIAMVLLSLRTPPPQTSPQPVTAKSNSVYPEQVKS